VAATTVNKNKGRFMSFNRLTLAQYLGSSGLYLFAISGFINQGGVYAGLGLMLIGSLVIADRAWGDLRREPAFPLAVIFTVYIVLRGVAAMQTWPDQPAAHFLAATWDLVAIGGLFTLLVGWWLGGDRRRIALVLQLAVLSLLLGVLKGIDWRHFVNSMVNRPLFGMGNGAGLFALIAITGLLIFRSSPLFAGGWQQRWLSSLSVKAIITVLFLVFTAVFVLSQTRAAWFAALLVLPVVFVLMLRNDGGVQKKWVARFEIVALAVLVLGVSLGAGTIAKRLGDEQTSMMLLFSGDLHSLPVSSVSYRVWLWQDALQRIAEHPMLGWGAGSAPLLIREVGVPGVLGHYHNLYLQLAVELGLVGVGLFALWLVLLVKAATAAWREGRMGFDSLLFLGALLAIFLIVSFFQLRHDDERGQYLLILGGALALTFRLCRSPPERE
jgi:O-antigen ligase